MTLRVARGLVPLWLAPSALWIGEKMRDLHSTHFAAALLVVSLFFDILPTVAVGQNRLTPGRSQPVLVPLSDTLWEGSYDCAQGQTALRLTTRADATGAVNATFEFGPISGRSNARTGSFLMKGVFRSADGFLQLNPISWISQPPGYLMVALVGTVSGATYQGKVDGYRCTEFSVSRNVASVEAAVAPAGKLAVPLRVEGGTFTVPVSINDKLTLDFVLDSGAADVSVPADVVLTLIRTGTLGAADFIGDRTYKLADGSTTPSRIFRIRSLKVGDKVLQNVIASVAPVEGSPLLGQSFLGRFRSWSIDNQRRVLLLE